ncbi:hypothetical protein F7642_09880 [Tenacibaculum finnmarkense genomovar ulcerans]|uniref:hypothetical protein n=1 Tax=Tenacibaculum finnmarkense TaxID=2781243 RepID=UPI00187BABEE|nr:hypothetical protein [Tenacibaculum finnmarkense]MBE7634636.1 hypothetical protein [Tenacibaculum finnmarkense genomovar ulcerans]MCD8430561.1 hypothetical protein [Tenacibaculum finnmarkense genomovar ulcerans]
MKKQILGFLFLAVISISFGQNIESSTRKFIDKAQFTRINKDWTTIAKFKSGIGETVEFYPIEVINLKTGEKTNALQLDMNIKKPDVFKTAWIGIEEINEFINFIEENVIPNLDLRFKDKSSEFIFKANEMTLSYFVYEKNRRLTIKLNSYDDNKIKNYTFWTETQVNKIPRLLEILKIIK